LCTGWGTPTGNGLINLLATPGIRVAIYGAETDLNNADVKAKILDSGLFCAPQLDVFPVTDGAPIPTLAQLKQYGSVLIYSNYRFTDPTAMGNILAEYIESGGGAVIATHSFSSDGISGLAGRVVDSAYLPFGPGVPRFSSHQT